MECKHRQIVMRPFPAVHALGTKAFWTFAGTGAACAAIISTTDLGEQKPFLLPDVVQSFIRAWRRYDSNDEHIIGPLAALTFEDLALHGSCHYVATSQLLSYLFKRADRRLTSPMEMASLRTLLARLSEDQRCFKLVLSQTHAIPAILQMASEFPSISSSMSALVNASCLPKKASYEDIKATLGILLNKNSPQHLQKLALKILQGWAAASVVNCRTIVEAGANAALAEMAARNNNTSDLQLEIADLMTSLARNCPGNLLIRSKDWFYHLICFAADATAEMNWRLVEASLNAVAACLLAGAEIPSDSVQNTVLPLLQKLSEDKVQKVMPAIARAIQALAESKNISLSAEFREKWTEIMLEWVMATSELSLHSYSSALSALASPAGTSGLVIAHYWLSEIIIHLSRQITPYSSIAIRAQENAELRTSWWQMRHWVRTEDEQISPWLWWPWAEKAEQPETQVAARTASDPDLSSWINAAPIGPVYARSVAAELMEASGRVATPLLSREPPPDAESLLSPAAVKAFPEVSAVVDVEIADHALCQALKVLCALALGDDRKRTWLLQAGILPLIRRLTIDHEADYSPPASKDFFNSDLSMCVQRQASRLLAVLSADYDGAKAIEQAGWVPWLQHLAVSEDCKLSSNAARALLHIDSARSVDRANHGFPAVAQAPRSFLPDTYQDDGVLNSIVRKLERQFDSLKDPVPLSTRLVLPDGIHLFVPLASHHETLAREGVNARGMNAPSVDIVFVHGIRGGAFVTWRREGVLERGHARGALEHSVCWPTSWVSKELPDARLISAEYAAPVTGWEGESLPLRHTATQLKQKLKAAGVGNRPLIFVAHSMGGLIVKEMIADDLDLRSATAGVVFYSVPHFGSKFADWGWNLRYVGASPASAVAHLKYGPHLEDLNIALRNLYKSKRINVLSFSEGQPTKIAYFKAHVVPHESAYPGFGEFVVLPNHDHINVCKPHDKDDPAYSKVIEFLKEIIRHL